LYSGFSLFVVALATFVASTLAIITIVSVEFVLGKLHDDNSGPD
jgi:hypothetical protein